MKRKISFILLIVISFTITACNKEEKMTIDSCENCAFGFYSEESSKQFGVNISLKDYTYDYKELQSKNGESRKMFLGHMLENGKIKRGFACGINNEDVFCIEGTRDGSKYEDNVRILRSIFGDDNCNFVKLKIKNDEFKEVESVRSPHEEKGKKKAINEMFVMGDGHVATAGYDSCLLVW